MKTSPSHFASRAALTVLAIILTTALANFATAAEFTYEQLREQARALAAKEYHQESNPPLPDSLKKLTYDEYRQIHFRREKSPWAGDNLPFQVRFFHRGYLFTDPVRIHLLEGGTVRDLLFSTEQFNYGTNTPPKLPSDLQFAGLQVFYTTNHSKDPDEVASFIGASYYRLIGLHQRYGASGRGLAIDTAEPTGEEFPRFTDFWIQKPQQFDKTLRLMALMDSPSVAGAFDFAINPGEITAMEVRASLFFRKDIKRVGFAPLTSMFLQGKNHTRYIPDFRPEVHDSDGLLWQGGAGEWFWRPLINPAKTHQVSRFQMNDPSGFGLLQRERKFCAYEDLDSRYELHPSLWVEPHNKWGNGTLELVEIPSQAEGNDNIVAFWVPERQILKGQDCFFTYRISAMLSGPPESPPLLVQATRINPEQEKDTPRFVIDFTGTTPPPVNAPVDAKVEASRGDIRNLVVQKNEVTGGWRVFFDLAGTGSDVADLRLFLHRGNQVLSETWMYRFQNP